jgi:hypothetical protein
MYIVPNSEAKYPESQNVTWDFQTRGPWVLRVRWNGHRPVKFEDITVRVVEGGHGCPKDVLVEACRKGMGLAWKEVRKRETAKSQLSLF